MKKLLLLVSLLFVSCSSITCIQDKCETRYKIKEIPISKAVNLLDRYNVQVSREDRRNICGGTIIKSTKKETLIITAAHCVVDINQNQMKFGFIDTGKNKYRVKVIKINRLQDIAVLKTTDKTPRFPSASISRWYPRKADNVWIIGYGASIPDILSRGMVSKPFSKSHYGANVMIVQGMFWYGNSGGGVFNENLELVGILIEFGPQGGGIPGWAFVSNLENIKTILENIK